MIRCLTTRWKRTADWPCKFVSDDFNTEIRHTASSRQRSFSFVSLGLASARLRKAFLHIPDCASSRTHKRIGRSLRPGVRRGFAGRRVRGVAPYHAGASARWLFALAARAGCAARRLGWRGDAVSCISCTCLDLRVSRGRAARPGSVLFVCADLLQESDLTKQCSERRAVVRFTLR